MSVSNKKNAKASGINISITDEALGGFIRRAIGWVVKHFTRSMLPPLVSLVVGGAGGYALGNSSNFPKAGANLPVSTAAASPVTIASPGPNGIEPRCTLVSGTATLPPGDSIWVTVQPLQGAQVFYFQGPASTTPTSHPHTMGWSDQVFVGGNNSSGEYVITAVVVNSATDSFLNGLISADTGKRFPGGVADTSFVPGVIAKDPVTVQRSASENTPCT